VKGRKEPVKHRSLGGAVRAAGRTIPKKSLESLPPPVRPEPGRSGGSLRATTNLPNPRFPRTWSNRCATEIAPRPVAAVPLPAGSVGRTPWCGARGAQHVLTGRFNPSISGHDAGATLTPCLPGARARGPLRAMASAGGRDAFQRCNSWCGWRRATFVSLARRPEHQVPVSACNRQNKDAITRSSSPRHKVPDPHGHGGLPGPCGSCPEVRRNRFNRLVGGCR
jgi:hypothetical protein